MSGEVFLVLVDDPELGSHSISEPWTHVFPRLPVWRHQSAMTGLLRRESESKLCYERVDGEIGSANTCQCASSSCRLLVGNQGVKKEKLPILLRLHSELDAWLNYSVKIG